jgi:hypothetical protein
MPSAASITKLVRLQISRSARAACENIRKNTVEMTRLFFTSPQRGEVGGEAAGRGGSAVTIFTIVPLSPTLSPRGEGDFSVSA